MTASHRKPPRATVASLSALGAGQLAELLLTASRGDTGLKRVLTLAVATHPQDMGEEIDRQVHRLRTGKGRLTAPRAVVLGRELTRLLDGIESRLGAVDPVAAVLHLLDVLSLAADILDRRTGEGRPVVETFASIADRIAGLLKAAPQTSQAELVEPLLRTFLGAPADFAEPLLAAAACGFGPEARARLRGQLDEELRALEAAPRRPDVAGPRVVRLSTALAQLADAAGDAHAFAAAQGRLAPALRDHVGIATRLLEAGRPNEALSALNAAAVGSMRSNLAFDEMRIRLLDALGRREEAQAAQWELFSSTLSVDALRGYLRRLPDFEDVEREEEALRLAERHTNTSAVLAFLTAWPDLRRAGAQVRARQAHLDGSAADLVRQAEALAHRDPLAATVLFRARVTNLLAAKRPGAYAAAGRHLLDCAALASHVEDWEGRPDQASYVARLRLAHPSKAALWRPAAAG